ncbi:MAG: GCN5-related N-acetyltransferase [Edaphobacter sp.]|nr:GCN5-related N-acetyltransferase [Edaphobacter sp.]
MHIREAEVIEAATIATLINAAFQVERTFKDGDRTSVAEIEGMFTQGCFLVTEDRGRLLGSVFVRITGDTGYFGLLAVDPSLQRGGIGSTLVQSAERYCEQRGCNEMTMRMIDVREDLLDYYSRFGYAVTGREPVPGDIPFTRPVEFVNMAKRLEVEASGV